MVAVEAAPSAISQARSTPGAEGWVRAAGRAPAAVSAACCRAAWAGFSAALSAAGLGAIVDQFRQNGYGDQVDSWVGRGQNQRIAPDELEQALGPDTIQDLEQETGMPRDQMLSDLADELPDAVDQFTPEGRLPSEDEVSSRWV